MGTQRTHPETFRVIRPVQRDKQEKPFRTTVTHASPPVGWLDTNRELTMKATACVLVFAGLVLAASAQGGLEATTAPPSSQICTDFYPNGHESGVMYYPINVMRNTLLSALEGNYTYTLGVCAPVPCPAANVPDGKAGACQVWNDADDPTDIHERVLGRIDDVLIVEGVTLVEKDGVTINYYGGESCSGGYNRTTQLELVCDSDYDEPEVLFIGEVNHCEYVFYILTAVGACPIPVGDTTPTPWPGTNTNTGGGMSFWGVFFILLLIAVAVYLIGGVMYKRLVMGARGFEQMPNADTWRSVGAMCSGGSKRGASYDQI